MKLHDVETGVQLVVGIPGSGKSYLETMRLLEMVIHERRPIYTNLPLRIHNVRWYLEKKGYESLTQLVQPLRKEHWYAFLERYKRFCEFADSVAARTGITTEHQELFERWNAEHGEDVSVPVYGEPKHAGRRAPRPVLLEANWIARGSVVIIDEVHRWHQNVHLDKGGPKSDADGLLNYLTQHRHLLHLVHVCTQDATQVSKRFRDIMNEVIDCRNMNRDRFYLSIGAAAFGIRGFLYKRYQKHEWERGDMGQPYQVRSVLNRIFWIPVFKNLVYFRLYKPFMHSGGERVLRRDLQDMRSRAGIAEDGKSAEEVEMMLRRKKRAQSRVRRFAGKLVRTAVIVLTILLALSAGVHIGQRGRPGEGTAGSVVQAANRTAVISSATPKGVYIDGKLYSLGGQYEGMELLHLDTASGWSIWRDLDSDDVWVWRVGQCPQRFGSPEQVISGITQCSGFLGGSDGDVVQ